VEQKSAIKILIFFVPGDTVTYADSVAERKRGLASLPPLAVLLAICFLAAIVIWNIAFVGFISSDDTSYLGGARGWLSHFPFVPDSHWGVRHTVVLPLAASMGLFGESELALVLPSLFYQFALVGVTVSFMYRAAGIVAAAIAGALIVTLPLFALNSSIANADTPELLFSSLAFWLFMLATERKENTLLLVGAGASAGFAVLTRESAIALPLFYAVLFVAGYGMSRWRYWIMAGAFLLVEGGEMLYYAIAAGDPLHRVKIVLESASTDYRPVANGIEFDRKGAVRISPLIDWALPIFTRVDFAALFFFAVPALGWLYAKRRQTGRAMTTARMALCLAAVWMVFIAFALRNVGLQPRYYSVLAFSAIVILSTWLGYSMWWRDRRRAIAILALVLSGNLLALYVANKSPMPGPHALVSYLSSSDVPVLVIDPELANRSLLLLQWAGHTARVKTTTPMPGDLVFHDEWSFNRLWSPLSDKTRKPEFTPRPGWTEVWRQDADNNVIAFLMQQGRLDKIIPKPIYARVVDRRPPVIVYRVEHN